MLALLVVADDIDAVGVALHVARHPRFGVSDAGKG